MIKKAVVIALSDSTRLAGFMESNWGINFEVFEAVDTRDGSVPDDFNLELFKKRTQRDPRPGEMGCAVSHYHVIKEFVASGGGDQDIMLVAEDDARPVDDFLKKLNNLLKIRQKNEIVLLSEPIFGGTKNLKYYAMSLLSKSLGDGHRVGHYADRIAGTGLYLISREACRKFVSQVEKAGGVSWVADEYNAAVEGTPFILPYQVIDLKVVRPGLADWEGESTIQEVEGYEKFKQRKLAEHSTSVSGVIGLLGKVKSKINVTNLLLMRDLLLVSAKDLEELLSKKYLS